MKSIRSNQQGLGHVALLLVVVVVAAVGFAGWRVMNANNTARTGAQTASNTVPAVLKTKADVAKAASELEATSVGSAVNPDSLDSDLNSLL